mmetsp:Transcript_8197/g.13240  ORF Transcript_8197/g.13240 Transcript_8197/m.13240 type:complete len:690 (+) Transcript_8197:98-2167(+)|eukprot:CAMPEP_0203755630 /NCGR_PEP_ID=MMETSP0098-20131031/9045_1 /ASSEMBLY_ACC=CAM_ASM_000208 /TAXON_ID=96639 /ORGANISM=" , Strain NY0313808BC1" /LENGTH=689 /DNA_ID=CAMNT_0050647177 /DNA_START=79 /DNA_END=2148 /DNA_ORIENTATION=-
MVVADFEGGDDFDLETIQEDLKRFQEDDVVQEALSKGVDLRSYSRQIDQDLQALQAASIPEYVLEAPATAELYNQISECDSVLESMETILKKFQEDLGGISDEIKNLQDESRTMSVKLKNRKMVEKQFCEVLEKLVVPDSLILGICQADVNDAYLVYVKQLAEKMQFVRSQEPVQEGYVAPMEMAAVQEVEPQLEKLRLKAVAKVRTFLLNQIAALRKPNTNVQIMQQNVMLKYKYFVTFLNAHAPAVAEEVKSTYVDAMSRILYTLFKSYYASLSKIQLVGPVKEDVIAIDATLLQTQMQNPSSMYSDLPGKKGLSRREKDLGEPDAAPIIAHVARSESAKFHFEALFRSVQKHLMDSATSEFLFLLEFFEAKNSDLFNQIFARTLSLCLEHIESYLYSCSDVIALLLMIRTSQAHRLIMERRRVPCLDGYFDHINMMLWPQLKKVFDTNLKSVRNPQLEKLGLQKLDLKPHYVSRRYAQFTSTIYALSTSLSTSDEMLPHNLVNLRKSYIELLDKLVRAALQNRQHHRALNTTKGLKIFQINNIDAVLTYFSQATHTSNAADTNAIETLFENETDAYIEEELEQSFGDMIKLLKEDTDGSSQQLSQIVQSFASNWKSGLELLSSSVKSYFDNPECARDLLKRMFTQFLLYYTRFKELVRTNGDQRLQSRLVSTQEIMQELETYSHPK